MVLQAMKPNYKNLTFVEYEGFYCAYRGLEPMGQVFSRHQVSRAFEHLLGASARMYTSLGLIHESIEQFVTAMDKVMPTLDNTGKIGVTNVVSFMQLIQNECLDAMRHAEVGAKQTTEEFIADQKSKISVDKLP